MIVDNFDKVKALLNFENEGDFYIIDILRRKKENPDLPKSVKTIKRFYIISEEYYDSKIPEMKRLAEGNNARVYFTLNKRNQKDVALEVMMLTAKYIKEGNYAAVKGVYDKACGQAKLAEKPKRWVVDIDRNEGETDAEFQARVSQEHIIINDICRPLDGNKVILRVDTIGGTHLITRPFDLKQYGTFGKNDVHKNSLTLLYYKDPKHNSTSDTLARAKEYMANPENVAKLKAHADKLREKERKREELLEWLHERYKGKVTEAANWIGEIITHYQSKEYRNKPEYMEYDLPPMKLYSIIFRYAEKYGYNCNKEEWDIYANPFTVDLFYIYGYYVGLDIGQGSRIFVIEEG